MGPCATRSFWSFDSQTSSLPFGSTVQLATNAKAFACMLLSTMLCVNLHVRQVAEVTLVGTAPWIGKLGRTLSSRRRNELRRIKSFLKLEVARSYVCKRTGKRKIAWVLPLDVWCLATVCPQDFLVPSRKPPAISCPQWGWRKRP